MSATPPSQPAAPDRENVQHYFDVLAVCVVECADYRAGRRDVFLWNARRAAEAILYALTEGTVLAKQVVASGKDQRGVNLQELARDLTAVGRLRREVEPYINVMRLSGNLGAHAQGRASSADQVSIRTCARAIPEAVKWLYEESELRRPMPQAVRDALRDLDAETPRVAREQRVEDELAAAKRGLEAQRLANERLTEQLYEAQADARPQSARWPWVVASLLAGLVGGAGAYAVLPTPPKTADDAAHLAAVPMPEIRPDVLAGGSPDAEKAGSEQAMGSAANQDDEDGDAETDVAVGNTGAAIESDAGIGLPPPTMAEQTCPDGWTRIAATVLHLTTGPYPRPTWPEATNEPPTMTVPSFCVMTEAATAEAAGKWLDARQLDTMSMQPRGKCRGNFQLEAFDLPANCVTWVAANEFCHHLGLELPTVAQWEAIVRADPRPTLAGGTGEWSRDSFPPAVFGYTESPSCDDVSACEHLAWSEEMVDGPDSEPKLAWNKRRAWTGMTNLSFRCAKSPD